MVRVFRDFGNRGDRQASTAEVSAGRLGTGAVSHAGRGVFRLAAAAAAAGNGLATWIDHLGWHDQGDGRWFYGLNVENGRIRDRDGLRLKTALREICRAWQPGIRLTPQQNVLLTDLVAASTARRSKRSFGGTACR